VAIVDMSDVRVQSVSQMCH